jgi:formate hydrogenlyase subunit 3/multisubunit Na+/H+ antiporter MnhD subunit
MPEAGFLDGLVKLASLGASGVCIFAIFWIGWLIPRTDADRAKTLRYYMGTCIVIAIISAASGIANAMFNAETIKGLQAEKTSLVAKEAEAEAARVDADKRLAETAAATKAITTSLEIVLNAKEAEALRTDAPPEIKNNIQILKKSVEQLSGLTQPQ